MPANADAADLPPPMNHVFVDFENVHHVDPALFDGKRVSLVLLLGAKQTRIEAGIVETLLKHAASVNLVRLSTSGRNALDMTLAYYVGRAAVQDPTAYFHIISKDTDFDPLVTHLRSLRIRAHRHSDYASLTFSGTPKPGAAPVPASSPATLPSPPAGPSASAGKDQLSHVLERLSQNAKNRPRKKETLERHIRNICGKTTTDADVQTVLARLIKGRHIHLNDKDEVTYTL